MCKILLHSFTFLLCLYWSGNVGIAQSFAYHQDGQLDTLKLRTDMLTGKENTFSTLVFEKDKGERGIFPDSYYSILGRNSAEGGKTKIYFVGDGNIQKSFSEGSGIAANTGLGVVFFREWSPPTISQHNLDHASKYDKGTYSVINNLNPDTVEKRKKIKFKFTNPFQNVEFSLKINIASTTDTIIGKYINNELINRRDFGTYLLIPTNSKQAANFDFLGYFHHSNNNLTRIINGINVNFTASNSIWNIDSTTAFLAGAMLRAGVFYDFVPDNVRKSEEYSVTIGINYSMRALLGDLTFASESAKRGLFLGTKEKLFLGPEINLGIRLQNIRAEVSIPFLKANTADIPGLTGAQFVTSIRFVGGFPLKIEESSK